MKTFFWVTIINLIFIGNASPVSDVHHLYGGYMLDIRQYKQTLFENDRQCNSNISDFSMQTFNCQYLLMRLLYDYDETLWKDGVKEYFTINKIEGEYEVKQEDGVEQSNDDYLSINKLTSKLRIIVVVITLASIFLLVLMFFVIRYNTKIRRLNYVLGRKSNRLIDQYKLIQAQKSTLESYAHRLENENTIAHFETLKNQLDPHMLFNALTVLKNIIDRDRNEAKEFVNDLSHILRYAIRLKSNLLVTLDEELVFVTAYINIFTKRYQNCFNIEINIPDFIRDYYIPPFSLQLIVENVIKHNALNEQEPIEIKIFYKEDAIHIINTKTKRKSIKTISIGVGHQNLINRYKLVSVREPVFLSDEQFFSATLPLIKEE